MNINCQASDGRKSSPLHLAAGYNRVRIVQILLKQGPFTGAHWPLADVLAKDKGGLVPLHNACSYGHVEVVEILLKCGANPNSADLWQFTPLHEAAQKGRVDVCNLLLAYGADPHVINCHGKSALELASAELADQLARTYRGCKLLESCQQADITKMKKVLSSDTINFESLLNGETPLHAAVASPFAKRRVVVELLLRKGAGVLLCSTDGATPLHLAAQAGHTESVELLLKHGARVNVADVKGDTPLHRAARAAHSALCARLLSRGADKTIRNSAGESGEDLLKIANFTYPDETHVVNNDQSNERIFLEAARSGDLETVKRLCNASNVNCRDLEGRQSTPLHFAAGFNRVEGKFCRNINRQVSILFCKTFKSCRVSSFYGRRCTGQG